MSNYAAGDKAEASKMKTMQEQYEKQLSDMANEKKEMLTELGKLKELSKELGDSYEAELKKG